MTNTAPHTATELHAAPIGTRIVSGWSIYQKNQRGVWSNTTSSDPTTYTSADLALTLGRN